MKLLGKAFLLSFLFTFIISFIDFPFVMIIMLYNFPEEWVDLIYLIFTGGLWFLIFLITYIIIIIKREND